MQSLTALAILGKTVRQAVQVGRASPASHDGATGYRLTHEPALDGLRALGVIAVMFRHADLMGAGADLCQVEGTFARLSLRGGFVGLEMLFVLSGFLITALLLREYERTGRISFVAFYGRRVFRLIPALILLLAASGAYIFWPLPGDNPQPLKAAIPLALFSVVNTYMIVTWRGVGMLTHLWSLGLEERFYTVWPIMLLVLLRTKIRRRWICLIVFTIAVGSALLRSVWWGNGSLSYGYALANGSLPARADGPLIGALLAMLLCWCRLPRSVAARVVGKAVAWGALVLLLILAWKFDHSPALFLVASTATALLIGGVIAGNPRLLRTILAAPPLVWLGRISYGLYLWHVPVYCLVPILLFRLLGHSHAVVVASGALAFGLAIALAATSYYLVERHFLRWKTLLFP